VLATRVDRFGRVDFRGLADQPDDLELYLRYLGD
jgi:hypothetical protein